MTRIFFLLFLISQTFVVSQILGAEELLLSADKDFFAVQNTEGRWEIHEASQGQQVAELEVEEKLLWFKVSEHRDSMLLQTQGSWYFRQLTFPETLYRLDTVVWADYRDAATLFLLLDDGWALEKAIDKSTSLALFRTLERPLSMRWSAPSQSLLLLFPDKMVAYLPETQKQSQWVLEKPFSSSSRVVDFLGSGRGSFLVDDPAQGLFVQLGPEHGYRSLGVLPEGKGRWRYWDQYLTYQEPRLVTVYHPVTLALTTKLQFPHPLEPQDFGLTSKGLVMVSQQEIFFQALSSKQVYSFSHQGGVKVSLNPDKNSPQRLKLLKRLPHPDGLFELRFFETGWVEIWNLPSQILVSSLSLSESTLPERMEFSQSAYQELILNYANHTEMWDWTLGKLLRKSPRNE